MVNSSSSWEGHWHAKFSFHFLSFFPSSPPPFLPPSEATCPRFPDKKVSFSALFLFLSLRNFVRRPFSFLLPPPRFLWSIFIPVSGTLPPTSFEFPCYIHIFCEFGKWPRVFSFICGGKRGRARTRSHFRYVRPSPLNPARTHKSWYLITISSIPFLPFKILCGRPVKKWLSQFQNPKIFLTHSCPVRILNLVKHGIYATFTFYYISTPKFSLDSSSKFAPPKKEGRLEFWGLFPSLSQILPEGTTAEKKKLLKNPLEKGGLKHAKSPRKKAKK